MTTTNVTAQCTCGRVREADADAARERLLTHELNPEVEGSLANSVTDHLPRILANLRAEVERGGKMRKHTTADLLYSLRQSLDWITTDVETVESLVRQANPWEGGSDIHVWGTGTAHAEAVAG